MAIAKKNQRLPLTHADIPRCVPGTKLGDPAIKELAAKASALFQYQELARETGLAEKSLVGVLIGSDIEVLETSAVREYMDQKTRPDVGEPEVEGEEDSDDEARDDRSYKWSHREIHQYRKPIPERVLAKCVQIKEACPGAQFTVHFLERDRDPFMSVSIGDEEEYFFEVWDEPNFSGKLTTADAQRANLRNKPK